MKKYLIVTFFCLLFLSCSQKLPVKNFSIKKSSGEEVFLKLEVADTFDDICKNDDFNDIAIIAHYDDARYF